MERGSLRTSLTILKGDALLLCIDTYRSSFSLFEEKRTRID